MTDLAIKLLAGSYLGLLGVIITLQLRLSIQSSRFQGATGARLSNHDARIGKVEDKVDDTQRELAATTRQCSGCA
jgi:hypothetical protein